MSRRSSGSGSDLAAYYNFKQPDRQRVLEQRDGGLSVFGQSIMERMQRVGMAGTSRTAAIRRRSTRWTLRRSR